MKPRLHSVRLHFCLAGFAGAGVLAVGLAVSWHASPPETLTAARGLPLLVSRSPAIPEHRAAVPSIGRAAAPDEREAARAAFLHLKTNGFGEADRYRCGILFRQWATLDFIAALDCADRQPSGMWREEMFGWLALVIAPLNPAEAATMADRDMVTGPVRNETAIAIIHHWARADLARAAAWADTFPQGPIRDRALDEVAGFMRDVPPARSPN